MIDPETGNLTISATIQIKPGASLESVLNLHLGETRELIDRNNDWKMLMVNNVEVEGAYFILTFGFSSDVLGSVELIRSKSRFDLTADWHKWSEESETELLIFNCGWIRN